MLRSRAAVFFRFKGIVIKKVLVIRYSQSGQLTDIVQSILAPLREDSDIVIHEEVLEPVKPFPFPWSFFTFLDAFPESVQLKPAAIKPLTLSGDESFDLVILAYQGWYLSPSQPVTAFLQSAEGKKLLAGKPVVTVTACRNMWLMAQDTVKRLLADAGARLVDHIAFVDNSHVFATFFTTPYWLLTGRREGFFGLPRAGISLEEIAGATRFGKALDEALQANREQTSQPMLGGLRAAVADPALAMSERAGYRAFRAWSSLIIKAGKPGQMRRRPLLLLFVTYLIVMIATVVPISLILRQLLKPVLRKRLLALKEKHELPSGSGEDRLKQFG